jgi:hypothetical protein
LDLGYHDLGPRQQRAADRQRFAALVFFSKERARELKPIKTIESMI